MEETFISLNNICRYYSEGSHNHHVLKGASLEIKYGERVALLGRSGCGKSTLLNIISGIDLPDSGDVCVGGINLTELSERDRTLFRREKIGFIYQFFNLVPTLTAAENIAFILELNKHPSAEIIHRTKQILTQIELQDKAALFPSQLSGGEQQRIAIARALVHKPLIVLADEPTGNLDAKTGRLMLMLLEQMLKENNGSLLLVTHSLAVAKMADRIITLEEGVLSEREGEFAW